jgi:hypothetical protein
MMNKKWRRQTLYNNMDNNQGAPEFVIAADTFRTTRVVFALLVDMTHVVQSMQQHAVLYTASSVAMMDAVVKRNERK